VCEESKLWMTDDKEVLSVELLGYQITVLAIPVK
jgi:hypothetical protein